ncbi:MAG: ATP-binding protein [Desulfosarcinaceae bacterium]|nr:ATP-binding protein [Desulfosarcinaceae bacterium]
MSSTPWALFFLRAICLLDLESADGGKRIAAGSPTGGTAEWIADNWQKLGLGDTTRADLVGKICRKVSSSQDAASQDAASTEVSTGHDAYAGVEIPTDLIAAGVQLARSLELKRPNTFREICASLPDDTVAADLISAFDVERVGPHPYFSGTIQVKIRCRDPELHRALKHHECVVLGRLNELNQRVRPRFLFSELIYEIEPDGYQPVDLKFSVDTSAALQLFMGNRLYTDKRVFLRELIQNAVDACNLRKLTDREHASAISIRFNEDISRITVRDNGIGMDRQWLEKYFLSIGISFYQSDEIKSVNRDPRIDIGFISQFGIGFLSSFLVSEKIVVRTRKRGQRGLVVTITSLKEYFDVRFLDEDLPIGTEVTLYLKPSHFNYSRSLEFVGYLKTNIRFLQIPVDFIDELGNRRIIGNEPLTYAHQHSDLGDFVAPIAFDDSEGYLYLRTKLHVDRIFSLESAMGGVSVFQDGIFVNQDETLLPEGARQSIVGRINLKGRDKCELSMDRNRIFWTGDHKKRVRDHILLALADLANQVLDRLNHQETPDHIKTAVTNQLAIFFESSDVNDAIHDRLCTSLQRIVEKRFRNFVRIHFAHTRSAAGVPDADGYGERWQQRVLASFASKN